MPDWIGPEQIYHHGRLRGPFRVRVSKETKRHGTLIILAIYSGLSVPSIVFSFLVVNSYALSFWFSGRLARMQRHVGELSIDPVGNVPQLLPAPGRLAPDERLAVDTDGPVQHIPLRAQTRIGEGKTRIGEGQTRIGGGNRTSKDQNVPR